MTDIDPKALEHACQCAGRSVHHFDRMGDDLPLRASIIAHARAIEQHEAFKREVSEFALGVKGYMASVKAMAWQSDCDELILPKPDPLVDAWQMAFPGNHIEDARDECAKISAAIEARGGRIVWEGE